MSAVVLATACCCGGVPMCDDCCSQIKVVLGGFTGSCSFLNGEHILDGCVLFGVEGSSGISGGYSKVVGSGSNPYDYRIEFKVRPDGGSWEGLVASFTEDQNCPGEGVYRATDPTANDGVEGFHTRCPTEYSGDWVNSEFPELTIAISSMCEEDI